MAKSAKVAVKYAFPSRFGSHSSMVSPDVPAVSEQKFKQLMAHRCGLPDTHVVLCTDEDGEYLTTSDRLDNGLADPNRFSGRDIKHATNKEELNA